MGRICHRVQPGFVRAIHSWSAIWNKVEMVTILSDLQPSHTYLLHAGIDEGKTDSSPVFEARSCPTYLHA